MAINNLTYGILQKRLQIANCCAAKQGEAMLLKQNKGIACILDQKKIQKVFDIIDSITEYIVIIDAVQPASLVWSTEGTGGTVEVIDITTNLVIGVATYSTSPAVTLALLADSVNTHVQNGTPFTTTWGANSNAYTAAYDSFTGEFAVIPPSGVGATYNGKQVKLASSGGAWFGMNTTKALTGGVNSNINDTLDDTDTYLSTEEIEKILDALCDMCSAPCTSYVDF